MTDGEHYEGKLVFLERRNPCRDFSGYDDGEYICIKQTPFTLHCVKPGGGYTSSQTKAFPLLSEHGYSVICVHDGTVAVDELIAQLESFPPKEGERREWCESVYERARDVLRQLRALRARQQEAVAASSPATLTGYVTIRGRAEWVRVGSSIVSPLSFALLTLEGSAIRGVNVTGDTVMHEDFPTKEGAKSAFDALTDVLGAAIVGGCPKP
jgi:hypothetical protein